LAYWSSFAEHLKEKRSTFRLRTPTRENWKWFAIGRAGFGIAAIISTDKQSVGVDLVIDNDTDKAAFRALYGQREAIESEFGEALEWRELPGKKGTRIAIRRDNIDPGDEAQYRDLHAWMLDKMERFRRVFAPRVKALPLSSATEAEDAEAPEE
jgi:hypothetical protein